jgi:glucosylceramidase
MLTRLTPLVSTGVRYLSRRHLTGLSLAASVSVTWASDAITAWRSSEDGRWQLGTDQAPVWRSVSDQGKRATAIRLEPSRAFQSILGLGASFDHASCYNLSRLDPATRAATIERLFHPERGIGMDLMRVCIGTSDFTGEPWYTYHDLAPGETDPDLKRFSIEKDRAYVLPTIQAALRVNPALTLYASPWSPPAWMKSNGSLLAGRLKPECREVYARYLARFVQAYAAEGLPIHALTTQNEPGYPNPKYPTCEWSARDQKTFIRDHLGPQFQREGITTKIWGYDHNWDNLDFPRTLLRDPATAQFLDGTAFHLYGGKVEAQSRLQREFPDKSIYFTEGSTFGTRGAVEIIQILRHDARSYNAWVFLLDEHRKPNNGPHDASATPIELLDNLTVRYNYDYYMYGQFMKFIQRGARRIESTATTAPLANVAFRSEAGRFTLVVANTAAKPEPVVIEVASRAFDDTLPARSVTTYRWTSGLP